MRRCVWLVVLAVMCMPALAEEGPREPPGHMAEILRRLEHGDPLGPEELLAVERFARKRLFRVRCNTLEDARFSLAQLQVKADRGDEAIKVLEKLAASTKSEDVKSAAQYDIAKVYHVCLRDTARAAEAFQKVTGRFAPLARRAMLRMFREAGQTGKAVEFLQNRIAQSKDKGEKLAMLRQLAELAKAAGKIEDAIAAYRQISEQFTEKDLQELRQAAAERVQKVFDQCLALRKKERWRDAEERIRGVRVWIGQLAAAGRLDECRAAQSRLEKCWHAMERGERHRQERERKERERNERERDERERDERKRREDQRDRRAAEKERGEEERE